jgi:ubiquinone/menaquinone biosynthesis C-methylase UbiE
MTLMIVGWMGIDLVSTDESRRERWRRYWDKHSASYDKQMRFFDRMLFKDSRAWVCSKASGETLEVGVGTGLNLPFYSEDVRLTGIDVSPAMLAIARRRASDLNQTAGFREADANALPFPDAMFDTVVCTFSLCAIPDERRAVAEMKRVLRPGGRLLLADHVAGSPWLVRATQRLLEVVTVPQGGEHFLRRPYEQVRAEGFEIEQRERFTLGIVERLSARKPEGGNPS